MILLRQVQEKFFHFLRQDKDIAQERLFFVLLKKNPRKAEQLL